MVPCELGELCPDVARLTSVVPLHRFEMYGEDYEPQPNLDQIPPSPGYQSTGGVGPALEVIELSNGEVVWSVVDAMRSDLLQDDDGSSVYHPRVSTSSDASYPSREGVQVLFREHRRMGSKGSASSVLSSRRNIAPNRPETKVSPRLAWPSNVD